MDSAGIEVRPLRDISGATHFAEVFLDDVEVDVANRVGGEGQGRSIMGRRSVMSGQRRSSPRVQVPQNGGQGHRFGRVPRLDHDPSCVRMSRGWSRACAHAANSARALEAVLEAKILAASRRQQVGRIRVRAAYARARAARDRSARCPWQSRGDAVDRGRWTFGYLMSRATTIGAGTAQIHRNTIAETVLGFPSHRGEGTRVAAVMPGAPLAVPEQDEQRASRSARRYVRATVDVSEMLDRKRAFDATDTATWTSLVDFGLPVWR